MPLQVGRGWVSRFDADGPEGLIDGKAPGQPSRLKEKHRAALAAMVENDPSSAMHGVVRWRIIDLCHGIWDTYEISASKKTLSHDTIVPLPPKGPELNAQEELLLRDRPGAVSRAVSVAVPVAVSVAVVVPAVSGQGMDREIGGHHPRREWDDPAARGAADLAAYPGLFHPCRRSVDRILSV